MISAQKITDTAYKLANSAAKAGTAIAVKGKEKADLMVLEAKLSKAQRRLGALVYSLHRGGAKDDALVERYIADVDKIEKQIEAFGVKPAKTTASGAKASVLCPQCGAEVDEDAIFCSGCGSKLA